MTVEELNSLPDGTRFVMRSDRGEIIERGTITVYEGIRSARLDDGWLSGNSTLTTFASSLEVVENESHQKG